ncbi:hypothetical protein [Neptunicella sp.]|uniref:hypothetical protein n=1 Tax=Neptunicella sp. TaxID=2125986 RepID=UPI003F68F604
MNKMLRRAISFWLASLIAFVIASVAHTQFVLAGLQDIGVVITMPIRIKATLSDLVDLAPGYGSVLALGLLLAFVAMSGLRHRYAARGHRISYWVYPLSGLLAVIVIHFAMNRIFDITLIAGARSFAGYVCQCMAGFIGGLVYAASIKFLRRFRKPRTRRRPVREQRLQQG